MSVPDRDDACDAQRRRERSEQSTHFLHSGVSRYFANSRSQSSAPNGGKTPVTRFHSVMLSPLSVRRVMPPTTTMVKTRAAMPARYFETAGVVRTSGFGGGGGWAKAGEGATPESLRVWMKKIALLGGTCRAVVEKEELKGIARD